MKAVKNILDIVGRIKIVLDVLIPFLESLLVLDLNKDGIIGSKNKK